MPFVPVTRVSKHTFVYTGLDDPKQFSMWVQHATGPLTATNLSDANSTLATQHASSLQPLYDSGITLSQIIAVAMDSQTGPRVVASPAQAGTGSVTRANALPPQCAAVVGLKTALRGKSYRGRIYWPWLYTTEESSQGIISAGTVTSLGTAFGAMLTALAAASKTWVLVSQFTGGNSHATPPTTSTPRASGIATAIVSPVVVQPQIRTQRRRAYGVHIHG